MPLKSLNHNHNFYCYQYLCLIFQYHINLQFVISLLVNTCSEATLKHKKLYKKLPQMQIKRDFSEENTKIKARACFFELFFSES